MPGLISAHKEKTRRYSLLQTRAKAVNFWHMDEVIEGLQFQKAETPEKQCGQCQVPTAVEYYQLAGLDICPACAAQVTADQARPAHRLVVRGVLYGIGAAVVCSVGYALISWITGMEIGLIAILVGYVVGQALRRGSAGMGGRRCQVAAVLLTYLAITGSYVPAIVKGMHEAADKERKAAIVQGAPAGNVAPDTSFSPLRLAIESVIAFVLALAIPFLALGEGFSGMIGIAIVFFGLQRAWQQTARDGRLLMGPYASNGDLAPV